MFPIAAKTTFTPYLSLISRVVARGMLHPCLAFDLFPLIWYLGQCQRLDLDLLSKRVPL